MKDRVRQLCPVVSAIVILALTAAPALPQTIQTAHEQSNYESYTSYESMMQYLMDIRATSREMLLGSHGKSLNGRLIPYAVFSRPYISQPWEAFSSGKPIVLLSANVHGGEKTLRESLLVLIRELATPGTEMNALLDDIIVVTVPSINPDGFEALPRSTRGNARQIDMNRDYMKLEQPELAAYVKNILNTWHPHVFVDGHNGGSYPYNICYQGPSNASSDLRLTLLCDNEIFPMINQKMEAAGYKSWYYSGGDEKQWRVGGFDPRIGRNYGGLINSVGILFESPGGMDREVGTKSGMVAYKAVAQYVAANVEKVKLHVSRARAETIEMGKNATGEVVVQMKYEPEDYKVSYLIGEGRGRGWDRPIIEVKDAVIMKKPVATQTRPRPYAYLLEPRSIKAVEMLKRHNINIEVLSKNVELEVQLYTIQNEVKYSHEYDHPASASVQVAEVITKKVSFPKGTYVIQTGQALGRVVTHMLEPETNDNVVKWNTMDFSLPRTISPEQRKAMMERMRQRGQEPTEPQPIEFPIFKLMTPKALPTSVLY
jgi:hypothetical protein